MIVRIVEKLKTGSIKNVIPFGDPLPEPPYVVVKEENDILSRGTSYAIIVHFPRGYNIELRSYIINEVSNLLDDFIATTEAGNRQQLYYDEFGNMPTLTIDNDDDTISMERSYYTVDKLF